LDFCAVTSSLWHTTHLLCGNPPQITIIDWWVEIFFADFAEATWGTTRWPVFVGHLISEVLWESSGVVHWFRLALPHGCYYVK